MVIKNDIIIIIFIWITRIDIVCDDFLLETAIIFIEVKMKKDAITKYYENVEMNFI